MNTVVCFEFCTLFGYTVRDKIVIFVNFVYLLFICDCCGLLYDVTNRPAISPAEWLQHKDQHTQTAMAENEPQVQFKVMIL